MPPLLLYALAFAANANAQLQIAVAGVEERVLSEKAAACPKAIVVDSPARALRRSDRSLVVYATHFDNWFLHGSHWNSLKPICDSAAYGSENSDPAAIDDRFWIQALYSEDGTVVIALASHEYLGSRHSGMCAFTPKGLGDFPCWFSSIIQLESSDGGLSFKSPKKKIVATPQIPFDKNRRDRVGFLTTSNIVSDGQWKYVLIYVDGYKEQKSGTCVFRTESGPKASHWVAWDGVGFNSSLNRVPDGKAKDAIPTCAPVPLGSINRGLVRHRESTTWVAVGPARAQDGDRLPGIYFSTSTDLLKWEKRQLVAPLQIAFEAPRCPPVYKYPSLIDHDAPGHSFDSIGSRAYLYATKVLFNNCRYAGRELVRIPLSLRLAR